MSTSIRNAAETDLDRITEIYADAVNYGTASYELKPPSRDEMGARFAALADDGYPYIVAEQDGRILGYAYASAFRPRPAYRFIVENSVYVAPDAQGLGIGKLLLERLITDTKALGFRQVIAVIGDGTPESPSVKLHEKLGFRHSGRLEGSGFKRGRWLDTVFMQLTINGGNASDPDPASQPERRFQAELRKPRG